MCDIVAYNTYEPIILKQNWFAKVTQVESLKIKQINPENLTNQINLGITITNVLTS
jgi:hypothetical protein